MDGEQSDVNASGGDAIGLCGDIRSTLLVAQTASLPSVEEVAQQEGEGATGNVASEVDLLPFLSRHANTIVLLLGLILLTMIVMIIMIIIIIIINY